MIFMSVTEFLGWAILAGLAINLLSSTFVGMIYMIGKIFRRY